MTEDKTGHCLQVKSETVVVKERLCNVVCSTLKRDSTVVIMLVLTAVIGVLSAFLVHRSDGRSAPGGLIQAPSLVDSSQHLDYADRVERRSYGSPDLLTEASRQEVANRVSKKALVKRDTRAEKDISAKAAGGTHFLTIDVRKREDAGDEDQYVVVFDAGSTGTRVHVYQFHFEDDGKNCLFCLVLLP